MSYGEDRDTMLIDLLKAKGLDPDSPANLTCLQALILAYEADNLDGKLLALEARLSEVESFFSSFKYGSA